MPTPTRPTLTLREKAIDHARTLIRERAPRHQIEEAQEVAELAILGDDTVASARSDLLLGVSQAELGRRQDARDAERKRHERKGARAA